MYTRIVKAVWFFFLMGFMLFFMYIYAALPQDIVFSSAIFSVTMSKNAFFYSALPVVLLVNMSAFLKDSTFPKRPAMKIFVLVQLTTLNLFFAMLLITLLFLNGGYRFAPSAIGILLYGSVTIVMLWALGGLGYFIFRHLNS